jgi:tRNA A37 threonylcarbamoyladenosine biosynthesis protein TsaE
MSLQIAKTNQLYPQQQEAIQFLNNFIKSDDLLAVLSGYAGTGKTHLLKHFLNSEFKGTCCVTAPTHKAVRVIENVLFKKGKTLHSLLGLRLNTDLDNFDISNPQYDPNGNDYLKNYNLIIIDECSQINKSLYTLITNKSREYKVKILFVGDFCQLPPVKEEISVTAKVEKKFELTEIIRQKEGNPLLILLDLQIIMQFPSLYLIKYLSMKIY